MVPRNERLYLFGRNDHRAMSLEARFSRQTGVDRNRSLRINCRDRSRQPEADGKVGVENPAVDRREAVEIRHRDPLVDLMHGLADKAEFDHRAMLDDETGIRRAARGRQFRLPAGLGLDGI